MNLFAIRHKPSGGFLPWNNRISKRGGTWVDPSTTLPPRFFYTRRAAVLALRAWLSGKMTYSVDYDTNAVDLSILPDPNRKAEDMEIVDFVLVETP